MKKKLFILINQFPKAIDGAINKKFGEDVNATSTFDIVGLSNWKTFFNAKGAKKKQIECFIEGYIQGNKELVKRIDELLNS